MKAHFHNDCTEVFADTYDGSVHLQTRNNTWLVFEPARAKLIGEALVSAANWLEKREQ